MATNIITSLNADLKPSIINFGSPKFALYLDADNIPKYFNALGGWTWMHEAPSTTPTEVHSASGAMTASAGGYKYFYTEAHLASGHDIHSCVETNPSPISTITGNFTSKKVVLTLPSSGENDFCDHLKIYGTDDGGSYYYYLGNVAIGTTSFEDDNIARDANYPFGEFTTAADGSVTGQTYLNYPVKNHRYSVATKTRVFVCGHKTKDDGTADFTNGSTTVTGTSTKWTRALVGDYIRKSGDTRKYEITAWTSATEVTIDSSYAGTTESGASYEITGIEDIVRWSALHPNTSKPMWWAFPSDYYRRIVSKDDSKSMGINKIGEQPIVFKKYSHYILTEQNDNDFYAEEARTEVGTCSHWSIVETSELGSLIFMTNDGMIYETDGVRAKDLGIDLSKTEDGINKSRLGYVEGCWVDDEKWYLLLYSSESSSAQDRMLVYDYETKDWVIWAIRANCISLCESSESGQTVRKPWIGTVGGFVYKMLTGNSLGSGSSGTLSGTITSIGSATLTDSSATFSTTDDGHKDVYVSLFDTDGAFQEEQKISSNTSDTLTVDTNWTSSPQVGWTYEIGSIRWHWKSKVFDFNSDESKALDYLLLNFKKLSVSRNVDVKIYVSEDPDMPDTADQSLTFDLKYDYYEPVGLYDVRARYIQFEITGHGVNEAVTIYNMLLDYQIFTR